MHRIFVKKKRFTFLCRLKKCIKKKRGNIVAPAVVLSGEISQRRVCLLSQNAHSYLRFMWIPWFLFRPTEIDFRFHILALTHAAGAAVSVISKEIVCRSRSLLRSYPSVPPAHSCTPALFLRGESTSFNFPI